MSVYPWVPEGDNLRCTEHKEVFAKGRACQECRVKPAAMPDIKAEAEIIPPPDGCKTTTDHERAFTSEPDLYLSMVAKASKAKDPASATIVKLGELGVKNRRAAAELARDREEKEYVRKLAEHEEKHEPKKKRKR